MAQHKIPLLFAEDADPFEGRSLTDLEKHDRRFHPQGYREGDYCKYRDALKRGDDADKLATAEKEEDDSAKAVAKIIDRYNAIGVIIMAQPLADAPYEKVFAEYGIKKGSKDYDNAIAVMTDAQEWFENEELDENDPANVMPLRHKVLDVDDALLAIAKGSYGSAPPPPKAKQGGAPAKTAPAPKKTADREDYEDLHAIREVLEPAGRLLNGRTGNIQALRASSRWNLLNDIAGDTDMGRRLDELAESPSLAISASATSLRNVFKNIVDSSKSNWNSPAGRVIPADDLPAIPDDDE